MLEPLQRVCVNLFEASKKLANHLELTHKAKFDTLDKSFQNRNIDTNPLLEQTSKGFLLTTEELVTPAKLLFTTIQQAAETWSIGRNE